MGYRCLLDKTYLAVHGIYYDRGCGLDIGHCQLYLEWPEAMCKVVLCGYGLVFYVRMLPVSVQRRRHSQF
jgi:hypothetical protein